MDERHIRSPGAAFLLAQLGGHSSRRWAARLGAAGMEPREAMLLRHVALSEGCSQRELAAAIGLPPSRIVGIVDRLQEHHWIERRMVHGDRRARAIHLTSEGRDALARLMALSAEHEAELTSGLTPDDRARLVELLGRIAAAQGLIEGVHPGFADPEADQTRATVSE